MNLWNLWSHHGLLQLAFQPIVALDTFGIWGFEVLARPYAADGHPLPVEAFFDHVAASGQALAVDQAVLRELAAFRRRTALDRPLFWNVHPASIDAGILDEAAEVFAPGQLTVEVTEKGDWSDRTVPAIKRYQERGYQVALDDFGAGYSGLSRLVAVSPDIVKVDRGIIRGIGADPVKQQLVSALTHLAAPLGFSLLAEGIETFDEAGACLRLGISKAQGYLFAKPEQWSGRTALDEDVARQLIILRAQHILADQASTYLSAEARWEGLEWLLMGLSRKPLPQWPLTILDQAARIGGGRWTILRRTPSGWQDAEGPWTRSEAAWVQALAQAWAQRDLAEEWVLQDCPFASAVARSVAFWPIHASAVLVAWYDYPHQWSPSRVAWGRVLARTAELVLPRLMDVWPTHEPV